MDEIKNFAAVFPGQASQYIGMGKDLIERYPFCSEIVDMGERITSLSLRKKIMEGPMEDLTKTLICQPAVFTVSMICWELARKAGITPDAVAGHSLGEYSALVASGVITMEEGFYLVSKRASIMESAAVKIGDGTLLAILGLGIGDVKNFIKDFQGVEIANINSDSQVVVGGRKAVLENFNIHLRKKRIKGVLLNVSGPFHTSLMFQASGAFAPELEKVDFREPSIPTYLNYTGAECSDPEEIKQSLVKQIYSTVRWSDIIKDIASSRTDVFVEIGPKKVLKKIIEGIVPGACVLNMEDENSFQASLGILKS